MPNLVGIWSSRLDAETIARRTAAQLQRVRVPGIAYSEYSLVEPGFSAALLDHGVLANGPQPVRSADGRYSLLLDGEIYNAEALRETHRKSLPQKALSTPELCLHLIAALGPEIATSFNGLFCIVLYDRAGQSVTLISDRYGFRPLYIKSTGSSLLFGTELKALAVADDDAKRLDDIGILELFCYGAHFHDKTWIEGYTRLGPATILVCDRSGVRTRSYWTYRYDEAAPKLDQETYFTGFATLLDRAVERCMQGSSRVGMFLSGGYDSRSVAASIRASHLPIPAFTFGYEQSRDVRFAAILAARLGIDHVPLTGHAPYLYQHCAEIVWRTEGMSAFVDTTSIRYHSVMKERMDVILTGFLAEFSGSHTWPQLLWARSRKDAIKAIYDHSLGAHLARVQPLFAKTFFARTSEAVIGRFHESLERVKNEHPLDIADSWNVTHLQPRSTYHAPSIDRYLFEVRAPHMDADLVDFLLSIPPYERLEQRVYKKMIAYAFPKIRDVPCTNSGRPINPHFAGEYASMVLDYAGRRLSPPHTSKSLGRELRDLDTDLRQEPAVIDQILRPLLAEGLLPEEIFDHAAIDQLINDHQQGKSGNAHMIALLLSWGLAAKFFFHGDLTQAPPAMYAP